MSNPIAIAVVTSALTRILFRVGNPQPGDPPGDATITDTNITTKTPDKARANDDHCQLNVFLYATTINGALRNRHPPVSGPPGLPLCPPLALDLHYLLTAYGRDGDELLAQRALGRAMSLLHDHPVLLPADLTGVQGGDLHLQAESARITPQSLSTEELSKLWTTFQTPFRVSAAYQVSVVLIDSHRSPAAAPPVLHVGGRVEPEVGSLYPELASWSLARQFPAARLGDTVTFGGRALAGPSVTAFFSHRSLSAPIVVGPIAGATNTAATVALPSNAAAAAAWPAGMYAVSIGPAGDPKLASNEVALPLAPTILACTPSPAKRSPTGGVTLTLKVRPQVRVDQRAALLLGDRMVVSPPRSAATDTLVFTVKDVSLGAHIVRLRVDGVDSVPMIYVGNMLAIDPAQVVEVVP